MRNDGDENCNLIIHRIVCIMAKLQTLTKLYLRTLNSQWIVDMRTFSTSVLSSLNQNHRRPADTDDVDSFRCVETHSETEDVCLNPARYAASRITIPVTPRKNRSNQEIAPLNGRHSNDANAAKKGSFIRRRSDEDVTRVIRSYSKKQTRVDKISNIIKENEMVAHNIDENDCSNDILYNTRSDDLLKSDKDTKTPWKPQKLKGKQKWSNKHKSNGIMNGWKPRPGNDLLFGLSPSIIALTQDRRSIFKVFIQDGLMKTKRGGILKLLELCEEKNIEISAVKKSDLNYISGERPHQGVCMEVSRLNFEQFPESEDIGSEGDEKQVWLVLDEVKDPMNFGAILRSSYFLGVDKIITGKKNCCPLTPIVSKASAGAMETMPVYAVPSLSDFLKNLGSHGWEIIGTANRRSVTDAMPVVDCDQYCISTPSVLVLGNEGYGLTDAVMETCTKMVTIPPGRALNQYIESLNVSVVTGILLYSLLAKKV
ncbi:rRNA methyltransferase 1, mitochondrial-like [Saccoglossus kowalevskii]|uniref:rRNA methyltransferase 1, mitochondrial n=1 Tax=Saccoglossus kowalevskii TaxID=10224 RepID=A0ABM0M6J0_SACKO|nr:PREDICTED: rRNA methyltransferase 1, mitochondrial-like [Saccoglossus kowalevskii]